jgi:hypothetical protein
MLNFDELISFLLVQESTSVAMAAGPYNYSYIFKYIIIGDMGVGKSCLLHQFTEKKCKFTKFLGTGKHICFNCVLKI